MTTEPKLYAHPQKDWPFPKWLPYPYVTPKEVKLVKPLEDALF